MEQDKEVIFIYNKDFNFVRSFPVMDNRVSWLNNPVVNNDGDIYLSRNRYGQGNHSNMISEIFKYDSLGNLLWKKELLDRNDPYLVLNKGKLYFGAMNLWAYQTNLLNWEIIRLDPTSTPFHRYVCNIILYNYFIQFIFPSEYNRVHINFV